MCYLCCQRKAVQLPPFLSTTEPGTQTLFVSVRNETKSHKIENKFHYPDITEHWDVVYTKLSKCSISSFEETGSDGSTHSDKNKGGEERKTHSFYKKKTFSVEKHTGELGGNLWFRSPRIPVGCCVVAELDVELNSGRCFYRPLGENGTHLTCIWCSGAFAYCSIQMNCLAVLSIQMMHSWLQHCLRATGRFYLAFYQHKFKILSSLNSRGFRSYVSHVNA